MLPARAKEEFLSELVEHGNVSRACARLGLNRSTAYAWRDDPAFARAWHAAFELRRDAMREEVVDKALAATGYVAEAVATDPRTGEPVLDDDFEPVTYRRLVDYDPRVLTALLGKLVRDEALRVDQRTLVLDGEAGDGEEEQEPAPTLTLVHDDGGIEEAEGP